MWSAACSLSTFSLKKFDIFSTLHVRCTSRIVTLAVDYSLFVIFCVLLDFLHFKFWGLIGHTEQTILAVTYKRGMQHDVSLSNCFLGWPSMLFMIKFALTLRGVLSALTIATFKFRNQYVSNENRLAIGNIEKFYGTTSRLFYQRIEKNSVMFLLKQYITRSAAL